MNSHVESRPQRQMKSQEFPISYLLDRRAIFNNYPDYQREQVWKIGRKQLLVNTILSGLPIPPLIARKIIDDDGETIYELIDGQQRFKTMCDFRDGKFETATMPQMRRVEPLWPPIEPGRSYAELSAEARHIFNDFNILLYSSSDIDSATGSQIYRNLQRGQQLTGGQRLKSYYSKINQLARELSDHSFWSEIYVGTTIGEEKLRGSLHVLVMEITKGYAAQKSNTLRDYACGLKDDLVTEDLLVACTIRLTIASHLFSQVLLQQPFEVISIYQAILLLQNAGYNLDHLERGSFTSWFNEVQRKAYRNRYQGGGSTLASLENLEEQRYFWEEHLPRLKAVVNQLNRVVV
jgi:hypothetical protein